MASLRWWIVVGVFLLVFACRIKSICPPGKFGWKCKVDCKCKLGTDTRCNSTTGQCKEGCDFGSYGPHCLFKSNCMYDTAGLTYTGTVSSTRSGHDCLSWNGRGLIFPPGDHPENYCRNPKIAGRSHLSQPWCLYPASLSDSGAVEEDFETCDLQKCDCPDYLFGENCTQQCHCNDVDEVCDKHSGNCKSRCAPGWVGSTCQTPCDPGYHGPSCQRKCHNCHDDECDHETGKCVYGCVAGFTGPNCDEKCETGTFGRNCNFICGSCKGGETCNYRTGVCEKGCAPGYVYTAHPQYCKTVCGAMTYGQHCRQRCGHCKDGWTCHHVTGKCEEGCKPGYKGERCDLGCSPGFHGVNCKEPCSLNCVNSSCDATSGICLALREHEVPSNPDSAVVVGVSVGAAVLLTAGVLILVICRRKRASRHG